MNEGHVGVIINYRRGPKSQRNQECLLKVLDIEPMESSKLIGWKVGWPYDEPRVFGMISKPHGRTGTLRVKFNKGVSGARARELSFDGSARARIYKILPESSNVWLCKTYQRP